MEELKMEVKTEERMNESCFKELIKATLFVSGDGIEIKEFADKFGYTIEEVKNLIKELKQELSGENGIHLIQYGSKVQLASNPLFADQIALILNPIREKALTKAAMQTLAIIAYKQPITRLEIENIRGVSADYALQVLLEHNLIEVVGRKDVVGKPLLFGTTEEFLRRFDLEDISCLPDYEELLERIKLVKAENEKQSDSLYRDFEISDEEIPDFLAGEEVQRISSEELAKKKAMDIELAQKLKGIDKIIKSTREELKDPSEKQTAKEEIQDIKVNAEEIIAKTENAVKLLQEEIERQKQDEFSTPYDNLTPETLEELETQIDMEKQNQILENAE